MTKQAVSIAQHNESLKNLEGGINDPLFLPVAPSHAERAAIVADALKRLRTAYVDNGIHGKSIAELSTGDIEHVANAYTADLTDWRDEFERGCRGVWGSPCAVEILPECVNLSYGPFRVQGVSGWRKSCDLVATYAAIAHYLDNHPVNKVRISIM